MVGYFLFKYTEKKTLPKAQNKTSKHDIPSNIHKAQTYLCRYSSLTE
jgi:hypothetical protein